MSLTWIDFSHPLYAQPEAPFWKTVPGINRRIKGLAQDFNFKVVNTAVKIIAPTNGAKWMRWILHPELTVAGPCPYCSDKASGGRDGYYHVTWFLPDMPAHPNCVCEWEIWFESPFA